MRDQGIDVHLLEAGGLQPEAAQPGPLPRGDGPPKTIAAPTTAASAPSAAPPRNGAARSSPSPRDIFYPPPGSPSTPLAHRASANSPPTTTKSRRILAVDPLPFTADLLPALGHKPRRTLAATSCIRFAKWTPFKNRNLAQTVGAEALAHPKITIFTHANAASLSHSTPTDPTRIGSVRVLNYARQEFTFTASHFVVCAGTVESCRILLCSPAIPNPHDQIGRYFHDHVAYHASRLFHSPARERIIEQFGPFYVDGTIHSCKFEASPELRVRDRLYAVMAHVVVLEPDDSGTAAIRNLLRSLQSGRIKEAIGANLLPMLRGAGDVVRLVLYSRFKRRRAVSKRAILRLNIDTEQAPNPNNRIHLSPTQTDALGLPTTMVDWRISPPEQESAARFAHIIRAYLQNLGLDPQEWDHTIEDGEMPFMLDTNHAMGGLRMGTDPTASVVNPNLTVHGLSNLHIASCAVFPSGSSSNPTFTMMALTLRLADHLATTLTTPN